MSRSLFGETGAGEDFAQAEWLSHFLRSEWRYDHTAEKWHHWDGNRWAPDQTEQAIRAVATIAAESLVPGAPSYPTSEIDRKARTKLLTLPAIDRALRALATFEGYGTNGDDWDAKPHLLGVANGIVDLRTNTLIAAPTPDMLVTKSTLCDFERVDGPADFAAAAPNFMRVMGEWMSDDTTMVGFLLLWFGASLFGFTPEQRFLLMTGIGRNGKGALKHSILQAVGEYGQQFDANLYMRSKFGAARSDQARADLLGLKGKRITFFSEPEGNRFNEELLKAHTGGDRITARALYSNNVQSWEPTHSITFLVNNAPEVDDLGPSMASRVMVADFRERFDGEREDKQLYSRLEKEATGVLGILCWAAARWFSSWDEGSGGITLPERVVSQSKAFMERNDPIAEALRDAFSEDPSYTAPGQVVYEAYKEWHTKSGQGGDPMTLVRFTIELEKKGFHRYRDMHSRGWKGLRPLGAMALAERGGADEED